MAKRKKKERLSANYLEKIPLRPEQIPWSMDDKGIVTLDIENRGAVNRIAQVLLRKPKVSHIHLDEQGSFVWSLVDGEMDIAAMGVLVEERFGEKAQPTYPRLAKFFQILDSYGFIEWN
ncbi:MAG: PqqD family protein [Clostridia bacterium]|nr:PqqD family protein [Clostridia bacterium]